MVGGEGNSYGNIWKTFITLSPLCHHCVIHNTLFYFLQWVSRHLNTLFLLLTYKVSTELPIITILVQTRMVSGNWGQWVKLQCISIIHMSLSSSASCSTVIQPPANVSGKAVGDGPSACVPASFVKGPDELLSFWLWSDQPEPLKPFGEWTTDGRLFLSCLLSLSSSSFPPPFSETVCF